MSVSYYEKPFFLNKEQVLWIEETVASFSLDEKIGQLFCLLIKDKPVDEMIKELRDLNFKPGAFMTDIFPAKTIRSNFSKLQAEQSIPLLLAANLERGADGLCTEGTLYGTQMQVAATGDTDFAYELGRVCAQEAAACGCNWNFGPVVDIDTDFHNPITDTRAFSSDLQTVISFSKAFLKGQREHGVAACIKHWPGDGQDERDQHMVISLNTLSTNDWDETYGKIYSELIEAGAETIMAAQIMLPSYSKALNTALQDQDLLPASMSYELTHKLLREKLGFNGLVVTDATSMSGYMQAMSRKNALPASINSGCDMILFTLDYEEDFTILLQAVKDNIVSPERLDDAVCRVLALKAHLGLPQKLANQTIIPPETALTIFNSEQNRMSAAKCADLSVTLVKDTQNLLPLSLEKHRRILLHVLGDVGGYHDPLKGLHKEFIKLLEKEGFHITLFDASQKDLLPYGNSIQSMVDRFDLILYYCSIKGSGSSNVARITWEAPGACNSPRYVQDIPTMAISVDSPYLLFDMPSVKTFINGYTPTLDVLKAIVEKIMGRSTFVGKSPVDPFCGLQNAHL